MSSAIVKSFVCVETGIAAVAIGVVALFAWGDAVGVAGALAQGIPPPHVDLSAYVLLALTIVLGAGITSPPTALVLGVVAARARRWRFSKLALAGAAAVLVQAALSAYPITALSVYFLSNTPPSEPFPFGADWHVPLGVVAGVGYVGFVMASPAVAAVFGVAVYALERWTRPTPMGRPPAEGDHHS